MTPSDAYKSGEGRDAGHDDFQAFVWRQLVRYPNPIQVHANGKTTEYTFAQCGVERPLFSPNGRIIAFADVWAEYYVDHPAAANAQPYREKLTKLFELKPRIYSVGSIIRQCESLSAAALQNFSKGGGFTVVAVVPQSDPKFKLLKEISRFRTVGSDWEPK